ncbi:MAG: sterol desaturase family protein, partial [Chitinophagaceae bacterium]
MQLPDLSVPLNFLLATLVVFLVVIGRYVLIAGLFHLVFYRWNAARWQSRKINERAHKPGQYRREVTWS